MDATAWDARYAAAADLEWGAEPNRWVAAELADAPAGRGLDLGAGEGRNAVWLAERGWRVTAVDFSAVGLAKGRRLADQRGVTDRVEWVHADVLGYTPAPAGYDLAVLAYLHLPAAERRHVVRAAAASLAPGGTLLVVGHDTTNLRDGVGGPQDPAVLFTPDDVVADLADVTDLAVVAAGRRTRPVDTPDGARAAIDAVVRLARRPPTGS